MSLTNYEEGDPALSPQTVDCEAGTSRRGEDANEPMWYGPDLTLRATRSVQLPPFWKDNPTLWFTQVEAALALSRTTSDEARYRHVIVSLDQSILPMVADIVMAPPEKNKYEALKQRIIGAFGESDETKLRRLIRGNEMNDEKPSHFLQRLRNLASGQCSDTVIRTLFLEQLPAGIRKILAICETADLNKLAAQADKIAEISQATVAAVGSSSTSGLEDQVRALTLQVDAISKQLHHHRGYFRGRRSRSHSKQRSSSRDQRDICYYHNRFGADAHHCRKPCNWLGRHAEKQEKRGN